MSSNENEYIQLGNLGDGKTNCQSSCRCQNFNKLFTELVFNNLLNVKI